MVMLWLYAVAVLSCDVSSYLIGAGGFFVCGASNRASYLLSCDDASAAVVQAA